MTYGTVCFIFDCMTYKIHRTVCIFLCITNCTLYTVLQTLSTVWQSFNRFALGKEQIAIRSVKYQRFAKSQFTCVNNHHDHHDYHYHQNHHGLHANSHLIRAQGYTAEILARLLLDFAFNCTLSSVGQDAICGTFISAMSFTGDKTWQPETSCKLFMKSKYQHPKSKYNHPKSKYQHPKSKYHHPKSKYGEGFKIQNPNINIRIQKI